MVRILFFLPHDTDFPLGKVGNSAFIKGKFPPVTQNPQEYKIGQEEQVAVELLKLQEKEAIEEVLPPYGPGFYNLLFVVPKQPEGWRPVLNVRALNEYVTKVNFKMETSSTVQVALADAKWAVTLDLKDAFFHIPMHPKARPFLRFMSQNKVWQFKVLPFGLTVAPFLFTWVMRPVVKELRRQGIRVHIYLDNMIIFHTDETTLRHHRDTALTLLQELGFHINWGKSQLVPVSTIVYLGMEFTLKSSLVRPPMDKCLEIKELAQKFMDNAYMTARQWSILLGKLAFLATMVPQGRLHQRELQFHLRQHWDFNWDLQTTVQIPMTESVQQTLSWWTHIPNLRVGKPLSQPSPSRTIFTDASLEGWGGHMGSHMASGLWNHEEAQMHINALELKAVINTITEFREMLIDQIVMIATDNTTVLGYLRNQGGTKSYTLFRLTQQLFALLSELRLEIVSRHIPGKKNFLADLLSRPDQLIHTEWTVQSSVLHQLWEDWFYPEIDAFATMLNYQLPLYYSPTPDPQALAVNALNQDWNGLSLYMYPPQPVMYPVLRKLRKSQCNVILVCQLNQGAPWYPLLLELPYLLEYKSHSCISRTPTLELKIGTKLF